MKDFRVWFKVVFLVFILLRFMLFGRCNLCGEVEVKTFLTVVEMLCDLCIVVLIVSRSCRLLDLSDMCIFCDISCPLHDSSRSANRWYNMLE